MSRGHSRGRRRRRWALALFTATVIPALLLGALEAGLRLGGFGYPSSFFVPVAGRDLLTANPRFGWRFFPPAVAREPVACELAAERPDGVVRVFVLGGSAAMGTPEPAFGLARILGVMLEESWPDARFEVVNAAMTAINSHVVRVIAADCARREPDLFVVYLGNNEVVGPYGPGSVFGRFSPGLAAIRAGIALRGTRTGQLLQRPADWLGSALGGESGTGAGDSGDGLRRWRGMEAFLGRTVPADDPRLEAVYAHLRRNLEDLIDAARDAGAGVVVSTVAVDLAETPPFASVHRDGLDAGELARWEAAVGRVDALRQAGRMEEAVAAYEEALAIDDRHAGLRFRLGTALGELGRTAEAREHLEAARDLDALRFRADRRINAVIREVSEDAASDSPAVLLADAERELAGDGVPDPGLFWEHVHLRFEGNHRLALLLFERVSTALAARLGPPQKPPPSAELCAERLGLTDLDRLEMAESILRMTSRAPFAGQLGHERRLVARRIEVRELRARTAGRIEEAVAAKRHALERRPDDLPLAAGLAELLARAGRPAEAAGEWRRLVDRIPVSDDWRTRLAFALADAGRLDQAATELRLVVERSPRSADARANLATVLERQGDLDAAEALYRRALADDPGAEGARLNLARLLERRDRFGEALAEYQRALEVDPQSPAAHRRLAEARDRHGELEEAVAGYRRALELDPDAAVVHSNLGYALDRLGRPRDAARAYLSATEADPGYALAWFNLGDLLLAHGRAAEAAETYRRGLALEPGNSQARENLALAERAVVAELRWMP